MSDDPGFAALLAKHYTHTSGRGLTTVCKCGEVLGERTGPAIGMSNLHRAHLASVLEAHTADRERRIPSSDELTCGDCSEPYAVWFTDNDVWNLVVGGPHAKDDPGGMLCPRCFTIRAEAVYELPIWYLFLDRVKRVARQSDRERAAAEKALRRAVEIIGDVWRDFYTHGHAPESEVFNALMDASGRISREADRADTYRRTDKEAERG